MRRESGFTLIELLVVIAIIGVLSTVGVVAFSTAQKTARISKRNQDLIAIQKGLELYKQATGKYPISTLGKCIQYNLTALAPDYMPVLPTDPSASGPNDTSNCYRYVSDFYGIDYKVSTNNLEMSQTDYAKVPGLLDAGNLNSTWALYTQGGASLESLIGYWNFDECQGSTINDFSSTGHTGTFVIGGSGAITTLGNCSTSNASSAWYNGRNGKYNSSAYFDGAGDDYVRINNPNISVAETSFSAWVKTTPNGNYQGIFGGEKAVDGDNDELAIYLEPGGHLYATFGGASHESVGTLSSGAWHHIVITKNDGYETNIYIDGNLDSTFNAADHVDLGACPLFIGVDATDNCGNSVGAEFNGQIDDARIYNYILTADQVKALYNQSAPPTPSIPPSSPAPTTTPSPSPTATPTPSPTPLPNATPNPAVSRVFITSTQYNGNLGGITGANAKCQTRANAVGLGGTWLAWIADSVSSNGSNIGTFAKPFILLDGTTIANNGSDLIDGTIAAPINLNENRVVQTGASPWTNITAAGARVYTTASKTCNNWNSSSGTYTGLVGSPVATNSTWTNSWAPGCTVLFSLYCFEQ